MTAISYQYQPSFQMMRNHELFLTTINDDQPVLTTNPLPMKYHHLLINIFSQRLIINQYFSLKDAFMMAALHAVPTEWSTFRAQLMKFLLSLVQFQEKNKTLASDGYITMFNKVSRWLIVLVNGESLRLQNCLVMTQSNRTLIGQPARGHGFEAVKFLVTSCPPQSSQRSLPASFSFWHCWRPAWPPQSRQWVVAVCGHLSGWLIETRFRW